MHTEIPVKVTAWVDEGVAPLVEALNEFPQVVTLDSCQGSEERPAHVYFKCRGEATETALFAAWLAESLATSTEACDYSLRVEWLAGSNEPMAELLTAPQFVRRLAGLLAKAANSARTMLSACGK